MQADGNLRSGSDIAPWRVPAATKKASKNDAGNQISEGQVTMSRNDAATGVDLKQPT